MQKILLVEDEESIANGIKLNLELEGYTVEHTTDGLKAKKILFDQKKQFDLIILDIMIPGINGFDLCYALRKSKNYTPILMLTAKKEKITGLQLGADEYITKPFNLDELLTRVEVLLRRQNWLSSEKKVNILEFDGVKIDFDSFEVLVAGKRLKMTNLEFKLMKVFAENEGKVISREELFEKVWEIKDYENLRTVDNFILRLRKYFEKDPSLPRHFHSIRGVGYKFTKNETFT